MTSIVRLGDMTGKGVGPDDGGIDMPIRDKTGGGGGGGGGGAQEGLDQIYSGAGTVGNAVNTAAQALGGGGGYVSPGPIRMYKKGGGVTTTRMKPSMKRNEKCPSW